MCPSLNAIALENESVVNSCLSFKEWYVEINLIRVRPLPKWVASMYSGSTKQTTVATVYHPGR